MPFGDGNGTAVKGDQKIQNAAAGNLIMTRHEERELALCLLFEWNSDRERSLTEIYDTAKEVRDVEESAYVREILAGIEAHVAELDALIDEHAKGWKRNRISRISLSTIYIAAYEMLYCDKIPTRVSLNEAIELTKAYDDEKAYAFVNGVLHALGSKAPQKD